MSDLDAIKVTVEDEGLHTPGPDDLWSESFYMDAVSTDRTMGVYVRIGRTVNQDCCIYTAAICEKVGRPPFDWGSFQSTERFIYVRDLFERASQLSWLCTSFRLKKIELQKNSRCK